MYEVIKDAEGKLFKYLSGIPTNGNGTLHLIEDADTGFVKAVQTLDGYWVAAQDEIDKIAGDAEADAAEVSAVTPTAPVSGGPVAPVESVAGNLSGTGLAPAASPAPAPVTTEASSVPADLAGTGLAS
jgi:hypothetical protein